MFRQGYTGHIQSHHFVLDLCDLGDDLAQHLVHLLLVLDVDLGQREQSDPGDDDESDGVEPGTDVGEEPKGEAEFDGVHHALNKEETAELGDDGVDGLGETGSDGRDGVSGYFHRHGGHHSKRIGASLSLASLHHDKAVQLHQDHQGEEAETGVGQDGDQGAGGQGDQGD